MKKIIITLIVSFPFLGLQQIKNDTQSPKSLLRFDGLYQSSRTNYLRFYPDGYVYSIVTARVANSINFISKDSVKTNKFIAKGTFEITSSDRIYFQTTNFEGTIIYDGDILKNKLMLHSKSLINGYEEDMTFYLVKF